MHALRTAALSTFVTMIFLACAFPGFASGGQYIVTKVYDGNTVNVKGYGAQIKVRLMGIDAPELSLIRGKPGQLYAEEAKRYLTKLVQNRLVELQDCVPIGYDLYLGVIFLDGKNINLEMVRAGLAEACSPGSSEGFDLEPFLTTEKEAKQAKRGIWSLGDRYVSPEAWRKKERVRSACALMLFGLSKSKLVE
jgi:micrococcal nuclease